MNRNGWRYVLVILIAFVCGSATAASHQNSTAYDYFKDGFIACIPTLSALQMTLEKNLGLRNGNGAPK